MPPGQRRRLSKQFLRAHGHGQRPFLPGELSGGSRQCRSLHGQRTATPSLASIPYEANMGTSAFGTPITSMMNGMRTIYSRPRDRIPRPAQHSSAGRYRPRHSAGWLPGTFNAGINIANNTPTAAFLANALSLHGSVEFTIQSGHFQCARHNFTANGAHELTLDAINYNAHAR